MTFEIGDKVATNRGLYLDASWREAGFKGKVLAEEDNVGLLTVKFKGIEKPRFILPANLVLRKKATKEEPEVPEVKRPFKEGESVIFKKDVVVGMTVEVTEGIWADVVENIPNSNLVVVEFGDGSDTLTVAEEVLQSADGYFAGEEEDEPPAPDFDEKWRKSTEDSPEVAEALQQILDRIEEIKTLLISGPKNEVHIYTTSNESLIAESAAKEEPAPEPVFKKAKEVKVGDMLYTEGGAYDKVNRIETKDSGYTSLFGAFGNKITQVPSGRMVQVLEEVA